MITIYCYPKCSTCKKTLKWLDEHAIDYDEKNITTQTPDQSMLIDIIQRSGLPIRRFFNTSGMIYRERGLKDIVDTLSIEEAAEMLSQEGMLIKRPLIIDEDRIILGYKEKELIKL